MAIAKKTYKNPVSGQPLIVTISSGCRTPLFEIKYCNLVKPFYYPNSPSIPRYSITCIVDPIEHSEFLKGIQAIEKNEKVESIIKNETVKENGAYLMTGKLNIKFQGKDVVPVYLGDPQEDPENPTILEMEDEIPKGEQVVVIYDILRYTKKNTINCEHGISFKPTAIYYFPSEPIE